MSQRSLRKRVSGWKQQACKEVTPADMHFNMPSVSKAPTNTYTLRRAQGPVLSRHHEAIRRCDITDDMMNVRSRLIHKAQTTYFALESGWPRNTFTAIFVQFYVALIFLAACLHRLRQTTCQYNRRYGNTFLNTSVSVKVFVGCDSCIYMGQRHT